MTPFEARSPSILLAVEDGVLRLTIGRVAKANALDIAMLETMADVLVNVAQWGADVVLIQALGERFFSAGGDLSDLNERGDDQHAALTRLIAALGTCSAPVICVQRGRAMGAGTIPSLMADIAILSEDATIEFPEMDLGLYPAMMFEVLSEGLPRPLASRIMIGARRLSARQAFDAALVSDILPADCFDQKAVSRVDYYLDRRPALRIARKLRTSSQTDLVRRVDLSRSFIAENLSAIEPETARRC